MCAIAGMIGPKKDVNIVRKMIDIQAHRGPDESGVFEHHNIAIGHRRLSIIDLVSGKQPMSNPEQTVWVVLNGEIYNYRSLRKKLKKKGHSFRTQSDTEVLIHSYEEYGIDFLNELDGIFSFALYDDLEKKLYLVRDYFGVKPLHYHFSNQTLRFSSEIKGLLVDPYLKRETNLQSMHFFLNLRYIPGTQTLFKGIHRVSPGHYLLYQDGKITIKKYFSLDVNINQNKGTDFYIEGIRYYLSSAIKKQLVSDVPLGVYLSGGLDSSSIVALMNRHLDHPIQTFSMGFNEPTDELDDAKIVSDHFNTNHHEISIQPDPLKMFPQVIWHAEEPKENILQGFLLSRFASKYVKVALGGLGGDEIFTGYALHKFFYPFRNFHALIPKKISNNILTPISDLLFKLNNSAGRLSWDEYRRGMQLLLSIGDPARFYCILRNVWDQDCGMYQNIYGPLLREQCSIHTQNLFDSFFSNKSLKPFDQMILAEMHTKLVEDFLMNEDRTSMANGLEVRVPFLDKELVNFSLSIPDNIKMKGNRPKHLFRESMKNLLPPHTINKRKWGFSFNPYFQFQKDLKYVAQRILSKPRIQERGWFNSSYLEKIINLPSHPRLRWHYFFLWIVIGMEIWYQMFIEGKPCGQEFDLENYYA